MKANALYSYLILNGKLFHDIVFSPAKVRRQNLIYLNFNRQVSRVCTGHARTFAPMEQNEIIQKTAHLIESSFDLTRKTISSEEDLVAVLAERIADMLEKQPEQLMSLLYRLDVLESKIVPVMRPDAPEPANVGLARLVVERQKQRIETKKNTRIDPLEGMDDWKW
jgi:hypothetical protein